MRKSNKPTMRETEMRDEAFCSGGLDALNRIKEIYSRKMLFGYLSDEALKVALTEAEKEYK